MIITIYVLEQCLLIWSCPKKYLSVWMSLGNFGRLESFRCMAFSSHLKLLATLMDPDGSDRPFENMEETFCLKFIPKFSGDHFFNN